MQRSAFILLWFLVCHLCIGQNGNEVSSNCWQSVSEEPPQAPPTSKEYFRMASFVADFIKVLNANEIYFCIDSKKDKKIEYIFASVISRQGVYFMGCKPERMLDKIAVSRVIDNGSSGGKKITRSLHHPAVLYLTSRKGLADMILDLERHRLSSRVKISHILVGVNLPDCRIQSNSPGHWFQATYNQSTNSVLAEEVFGFGDGMSGLYVPVVRWEATSKMTVLYQPGIGPSNFQGHVVTAVSMTYLPFVMESTSCLVHPNGTRLQTSDRRDSYCIAGVMSKPEGGVDVSLGHFEGYLIDVLHTVATKLNFSIKLKIPPPKEARFGIDTGDGNFSGLVGYLQRQEADIAMSGFMMTDERDTVMDFTGPIAFAKNRLYIRSNATRESIGWKTYVRSFSWTAWVAILFLLAIVSVGLWIIVWRHNDEDPHFWQGSNVVFILFSCMVQQGSWILPTTGRAQAILWTFWFTSVVLYASYCARLTSYLTVSTIKLPFTSLKEAVQTPGWRIAVQDDTATVKIFKRSKRESYAAVYRGLQRDPSLRVASDSEGIEGILREKDFGYFAEDVVMSYYLNNNCSISPVPGSYLDSYLRMGLRKNVPFADIINEELNKMNGGGILDRLSQQWWGKSVPCTKPSPFTELGFRNILTAFLLLIAGGAISVLFLVIEMYLKERSFIYALSDRPKQIDLSGPRFQAASISKAK